MDGSNCPILRNKTVDKPAERLPAGLGEWQRHLAIHENASKAVRKPNLYPYRNSYVYPLIWVEKDINARNISITELHRREYNVPVETFYIGKNTVINNLILDYITVENYMGAEMPLFVNNGTVIDAKVRNISVDGDDGLEQLINALV